MIKSIQGMAMADVERRLRVRDTISGTRSFCIDSDSNLYYDRLSLSRRGNTIGNKNET
jgi:hypothetical protein